MRLGLIANLTKPDAVGAAASAADFLRERGAEVVLHPDLAEALRVQTTAPLKDSDLVLCFGGDGTILHAVRETGPSGPPTLGVNLGSLGFLTAVSSNEVTSCLEAVLAKEYVVEDRSLVRARFTDTKGDSQTLEALNEIVVDEGTFTRRAVELDVRVSGSYLGTFTGDGLIVATPTGSTAYSLSAGGPIVKASLTAFTITPIAAHSLSIRPLVIDDTEVIEVENHLAGVRLKVTADGHGAQEIAANTLIRIERSPHQTQLAFLKNVSYYDILRDKLNWGGLPNKR